MELEVSQLVRLARRWWWLLVLGPLVGAAVAYAVSYYQAPDYTASTMLRINPAQVEGVIAYDELNNVDTLLATYRQMVWTRPVLEPVIDSLDLGTTVEELVNRIAVRQIAGTQLLELSVTAADPAAAAEIANAVAASLIRHVSTEVSGLSTVASGAVDEQLRQTQEQIDSLTQQIQALEESPDAANPATAEQIAALRASLEQQRDLRAELLQTAQSVALTAAIAPNQISVAARANPPAASNALNPILITAFGALAGLLVAVAAVTVFGSLDNRVRANTDLLGLVGRPQIGAVPMLRRLRPGPDQLFMVKQPAGEAAEAIRLLRAQVEIASTVESIKTLAITSAEQGGGKSTIAANLAASLAQTELPTILIDADLRHPTLHKIFGVRNDRGLSTLLEQSTHWLSVAVETAIPNLLLIPSGPLPANPADALSHERLPALLNELGDQPGMTVLDTPAVAAGSDALVIAAEVDAVTLVARPDQTRASALRWAGQVLAPSGARLLGVVLNGASGWHEGVAGYKQEVPGREPRARAAATVEPRHRRTAEPALGSAASAAQR